jgi:hypothetical protein
MPLESTKFFIENNLTVFCGIDEFLYKIDENIN